MNAMAEAQSPTQPPDLHAASPSVLDKVIGQRAVVEQIRVGLEAAWADGRKFDHALLVGPPGLGKSLLANVIGRELGSDVHEVLASVAGRSDNNSSLVAALRSLGLAAVTPQHVAAAIGALYPGGERATDDPQVIRQVFL